MAAPSGCLLRNQIDLQASSFDRHIQLDIDENNKIFKTFFEIALRNHSYIVGCPGVALIKGLELVSPGSVPLRLRVISLFYLLKIPLFIIALLIAMLYGIPNASN